MEPKGSSPHLQVSTTCRWPEPDQSNPCPPPSTSWGPNFILPLQLGLPSRLFLSGFPTETLCTPLLSPINLPQPSQFHHLYNVWWGVLIIKLHSPVTSSLLFPNILLSTWFSNTLTLHSFLNVSDQVSHSYKMRQNYSSLYLNLYVFGSQTEDKWFCTEW